MVSPPDDGTEYVEYHFYIDKTDWTDWKQTLDRDTALHDRLGDLIRADTRADGEAIEQALQDVPDLDDEETSNLLRLKLGRVHARASVAADRIRDDNAEQALVTIDKVIELSQPFARET